MPNTQLYIPKTVSVGFQNRNGTYTGKLAYIIYTDDKRVLRKEKSWNSWRDQKIEPENYDNVPTEGFVLNKKVGGYKSDWNYRQSYIRVFDPRGFEFEITCENLLFILENCSAIKGKGLEGQFVYSWAGTDLVLLPVECESYKDCVNYTKIQGKKVSRKELVPGNIYLDKNEVRHLYLGRHTRYRMEHQLANRNDYYSPRVFSFKRSNHHVFVPEQKKSYEPDFVFDRDMNTLVSERSPDFAEAAQKWYESIEGSEPCGIEYSKIKYKTKLDDWRGTETFPDLWTKSGDSFTRIDIRDGTLTRYDHGTQKYVVNSNRQCYTRVQYTVSFTDKINCIHTPVTRKVGYVSYHEDKGVLCQTDQFLSENQALEVKVKLKSGSSYPINKYLGIG